MAILHKIITIYGIRIYYGLSIPRYTAKMKKYGRSKNLHIFLNIPNYYVFAYRPTRPFIDFFTFLVYMNRRKYKYSFNIKLCPNLSSSFIRIACKFLRIKTLSHQKCPVVEFEPGTSCSAVKHTYLDERVSQTVYLNLPLSLSGRAAISQHTCGVLPPMSQAPSRCYSYPKSP